MRKKKNEEVEFLIVDLFCGAGGTTTGFAQANINGKSIAKVIACVNHDPIAIKSHWANHPEVKHFNEDIRTLDLTELIAHVKKARAKYPKALLVLWASLECTNFSKAKGGMARDADSRTLADHLYRYILAIDPDYIQIENVVEFMSWGPLDENGKPISRKNGQDFMRWREHINSYGYYNEWKEMNSANYGAYTTRNRLFGCFAKPNLPIVWPEPTHSKKPTHNSIYNSELQKWKAVKDVLDFSDEGESIFGRKKDLVDATLERIYAGLVKYIANGDTSFIAKYFSGRPEGKVTSIDSPAGTIKTIDGQSLVQTTSYLMKYNSMNQDGIHTPPSIENPCPTISCQGRLGVVQAKPFLAAYYGTGHNCSSIDSPAPTLRTVSFVSVIKPEFFIDKQYGKVPENISINQPAGTIMTNDKHRLVEATPFLMPTNFGNGPTSIEDPSQTITANRKYHYLINPSWGGNLGDVEQPCCVIVARQDKAPLYFVQVEQGSVSIAVFDSDSPIMVKIKQFMAAFGLVDIKMRMLRVNEMLKIQGFPSEYILEGTQTDQKKFIGNSVVPLVVKAWAEAMASTVRMRQQMAA